MKKLTTTVLFFLLTLNMLTMSASEYSTFNELKTASGKPVDIRLFKHASLAIDYDGLNIYVDPVTQVGNTSIDYTAMPKADYILITHEHGDHLDPKAIEELSKKDTRIILNKKSRETLGYGDTMVNGETMDLKDNIKLEAVPAYNTTPGREKFHPRGNGNGYVLDIDGIRIYIAGDTEDIPEMKDLKNIDLAFLPVNQPYTMTIAQAEKAALTIHPKILIPYHFSDTPVDQLKEALDKANSGIDVRIYPME